MYNDITIYTGRKTIMYVNAARAKETLYELLGLLEDGEENQIVITRKGRPVAKITDYYDEPTTVRIGVAKGKFTVPDDFDADNEEIAKLLGVE